MNAKNLILLACSMFVLGLPCYAQNKNPFHPYTLIAHRGGIVGSNTPENSLAALEEAIRRGYHRVEIDVRLSRDSVLITQHDPHFRKYFNLDRRASDMTWEEIRKLRHPSGHRILRLEEVLAACAGRIEVMLDNKIDGFDEALFAQIIQLLQTYGLQDNAMMIGTTASTEYFTGKVRLSCSIDQLKANQSRPDYSPNHYYLFARDLTKEDVEWAAQRGIPVVAAINAFLYPEDSLMETAAEKTTTMIKNGVRIFQIDGIFEAFFR